MVSSHILIGFLQQPGSYTYCPPEVKIKQTHASILALAPPYVFKIKKQVNLGFMDFTTLESRKANCERELFLNSRFCPDLYMGVIPICRKEGKLSFGCEGEIVEYALQMKLLPDGFFLHQLLHTSDISAQALDPVLLLLSAFYQQQKTDVSLARFGKIEQLKQFTGETILSLQQNTGMGIYPVALKAIERYTRMFYNKQAVLFSKRIAQNKIKDCHGDLHAEHIHMKDNIIHIYDCIEFNDRFRYIDEASDIAFLAMDLDFYKRPDLSAYVVDRMASLLDDKDMQLLMDFYKCYRACVRAKVEAIKSSEVEVNVEERHKSHKNASDYVTLALRYALFGSQPLAIMVCGRIGSGKSTLATVLAKLLGFDYLSSDQIRKEKAGIPLYKTTPEEKKQWLYSEAVTDEVYQNLLEKATTITRQGFGVVIDATFSCQIHRARFTDAFNQGNISYYFLESQASGLIIRQRLAAREANKEVISDARLKDFAMLNQLYEPMHEIATGHLLTVNTEEDLYLSLEKVCTQLVDLHKQ